MPSAATNLITELETKLEATGIINSTPIPVLKAEPGPNDLDPDEVVWFGDVTYAQQYAGMAPSYQEEGSLDVFVKVRRPGGGETVHDTVRDRCIAIWDVVVAALIADHTVNAAVRAARPGNVQVQLIAEDANVVGLLQGQVDWMTHVTS